MVSISYIKDEFKNADLQEALALCEKYSDDTRAGVKACITAAQKRYDKHLSEQNRLKEMYVFEREYYDKGYNIIAGTDEVGRGPLAGPVVAACVVLPKDTLIEGVNDSKKLSKKKREELYKLIQEKALAIGIGMEDNTVIDDINILNATYSAMRKAFSSLSLKPDILLADAVTIPNIEVEQRGIIKGDAKSITIACASIIAKVTRDRMMEQYAEEYPCYGFERNMGYGSGEHINALRQFGPCPLHRNSFIGNFV